MWNNFVIDSTLELVLILEIFENNICLLFLRLLAHDKFGYDKFIFICRVPRFVKETVLKYFLFFKLEYDQADQGVSNNRS